MARRYKDHKGRFVTKEVYEWLKRERAAAKAVKTSVRPTDPDFSIPKTEYPDGFVEAQYTIRQQRIARGKFKVATKGGLKAGEQRTRKSEALYQVGQIAPPLFIERSKRYETRVWLFEGLEGERASLHLLELHNDVEDAIAMVAIEVRTPGHHMDRIGSPYETPREVQNWIGGLRGRASGQKVIENFQRHENARLIWEVEIKVPNVQTKSSKPKSRRAKSTAKRSKQTNRGTKRKRQRSGKRRNVSKR